MERFIFSAHVPSHTYPAGDQIKLGSGYTFAAEDVGPVQRTFNLSFKSLRWFQNPTPPMNATPRDMWSSTKEPHLNALALLDFFERHRMFKRFIYPHPVYGDIVVRFAAPAEVGKALDGGSGWTESFDIKLIEQP